MPTDRLAFVPRVLGGLALWTVFGACKPHATIRVPDDVAGLPGATAVVVHDPNGPALPALPDLLKDLGLVVAQGPKHLAWVAALKVGWPTLGQSSQFQDAMRRLGDSEPGSGLAYADLQILRSVFLDVEPSGAIERLARGQIARLVEMIGLSACALRGDMAQRSARGVLIADGGSNHLLELLAPISGSSNAGEEAAQGSNFAMWGRMGFHPEQAQRWLDRLFAVDSNQTLALVSGMAGPTFLPQLRQALALCSGQMRWSLMATATELRLSVTDPKAAAAWIDALPGPFRQVGLKVRDQEVIVRWGPPGPWIGSTSTQGPDIADACLQLQWRLPTGAKGQLWLHSIRGDQARIALRW